MHIDDKGISSCSLQNVRKLVKGQHIFMRVKKKKFPVSVTSEELT